MPDSCLPGATRKAPKNLSTHEIRWRTNVTQAILAASIAPIVKPDALKGSVATQIYLPPSVTGGRFGRISMGEISQIAINATFWRTRRVRGGLRRRGSCRRGDVHICECSKNRMAAENGEAQENEECEVFHNRLNNYWEGTPLSNEQNRTPSGLGDLPDLECFRHIHGHPSA